MKKAFITISIFSIFALLSCPVFASNMMEGAENTLNGIRDGVQNMVNDAGNAMEGARDGIFNVIDDAGNTARDMGNDMTNDYYTNDFNNNTNSGAIQNVTGDDYTASRTAATDVNNTNNATVWVVLAIAAVLIIALVWYYAAQIKNDRD